MFMICDWTTAGHECTRCAEPVQMGQELDVDIDSTGEGRVVWTVTHRVCPEKIAGAGEDNSLREPKQTGWPALAADE